MIPQADLDRALARWKARKAGRPIPDEAAPERIEHHAFGNDEPTDGGVSTETDEVRLEGSGLISITHVDDER
jgi:hypothetical protein